ELRRHLVEVFGDHGARGDGVAADAPLAVLGGEILGQADDGDLRGAVGHPHGIPGVGADGGGVDDVALALAQHVGNGVAAADKGAGDVDLEGAAPQVHGDVGGGGV